MEEKSKESLAKLAVLLANEGNGKGKADYLKPKFIRVKQAEVIYNIGKSRILEIAREAGAAIKIDRTVLIDIEVFDKYLETFRIPKGY